MRVCGILNRIGYAFLVVALMELWVPLLITTGSSSSSSTTPLASATSYPLATYHTVKSHCYKHLIASIFLTVHILCIFYTYVPNWEAKYAMSVESVEDSDILLNSEKFDKKDLKDVNMGKYFPYNKSLAKSQPPSLSLPIVPVPFTVHCDVRGHIKSPEW